MQRRLGFIDGVILSGLLIGYLITWGVLYRVLDRGFLESVGWSRDQASAAFLVALLCLLVGAGWWVEGVGGERAGVLGGVALSLCPFLFLGLVLGAGGELLFAVVLISLALFVPSFMGVGLRKLAARFGTAPSVVGGVARGVLAFGGGVAALWLVAGLLLMGGEHGLWIVAAPWVLARSHEVWLADLLLVPLFASGVVFGARRALRFASPWSNPKEGVVLCAVVCAALTAGFSATGMIDTGSYHLAHVILWVVAAVCGCLFAHARPGVDTAQATPT